MNQIPPNGRPYYVPPQPYYAPQQFYYAPQQPQWPLSPRDIERKAIRRQSNLIGFGLVGMIVFTFLLGLLLGLISLVSGISLNQMIQNEIYLQVFNFVTSITTIGLPFLTAALIGKMKFKTIFPSRRIKLSSFFPLIFLGLSVCILANMASSYFNVTLSFFGLTSNAPNLAIPNDIFAKILYFVNLSVLPGFVEEFAFRGVIMQGLRRFGDGFALVFSAIMFGLAHGNLSQAPFAFIVGLILGYLVLRTGSIWPAVTVHFLNNLFSILLDLGLKGQSGDVASFVTLIYFFVFLLFGLLALIPLLKKDPALFSIGPDHTILPAKTKVFHFFTTPLMIIGLLILVISIITSLTLR